MAFKIRYYEFDVCSASNCPTIKIFGYNKETGENIEITIENPTRDTIQSLMETYDRRYDRLQTDISLYGNCFENFSED